jgi:hypothetical protein
MGNFYRAVVHSVLLYGSETPGKLQQQAFYYHSKPPFITKLQEQSHIVSLDKYQIVIYGCIHQNTEAVLQEVRALPRQASIDITQMDINELGNKIDQSLLRQYSKQFNHTKTLKGIQSNPY